MLLAAIGLVASVALFFLSLRLPLRVLLASVLVVSLLQGFGSLGFMSFALMFTAGLAPGMIVRTWHQRREWWLWALGGLVLWQGVSSLWSFKFGSAAYGVMGSMALLSAFLIAREVLRDSPRDIRYAVLVASPVVVLEAGMILLFRLSPAVEELFLASPIARFVSEPGVDVLFTGGYENVLDPGKSGGMLLNGNTAALLMALCACVYALVGCWWPGRKAALLSIAALCSVAMLFTGSKSPVAMIVVLPLISFAILIAVRKPLIGVLLTLGAGALAVLLVVGVRLVKPELLEEATRTIGERAVLWGLVLESVPSRWFSGLGFGNWRERMVDRVVENPQLAGDPTLRVLPPHNLFAQAWVDSGLIALLLVVVLAVGPLLTVVASMRAQRSEKVLSLNSARLVVVFAGLAWPLVHGMTDTTLFYGDNHTIPWFAILVAAAYSRSSMMPELGPSAAEFSDTDVVETGSLTSAERKQTSV
ncbi:O-antigen ligase family protein [Microbacterium memoriense]|uniref:O-antigen ligase family protein n=1 Tax=Microbacterium memoriense TaxID=2978350 RepID=A0ABT2PB58_9MICO|nr:O-antigen ligase family protein [Microbacterium memoriense]MCT9001817.1 O-antigen ligase family protein [Microbacterium memoriense]